MKKEDQAVGSRVRDKLNREREIKKSSHWINISFRASSRYKHKLLGDTMVPRDKNIQQLSSKTSARCSRNYLDSK